GVAWLSSFPSKCPSAAEQPSPPARRARRSMNSRNPACPRVRCSGWLEHTLSPTANVNLVCWPNAAAQLLLSPARPQLQSSRHAPRDGPVTRSVTATLALLDSVAEDKVLTWICRRQGPRHQHVVQQPAGLVAVRVAEELADVAQREHHIPLTG